MCWCYFFNFPFKARGGAVVVRCNKSQAHGTNQTDFDLFPETERDSLQVKTIPSILNCSSPNMGSSSKLDRSCSYSLEAYPQTVSALGNIFSYSFQDKKENDLACRGCQQLIKSQPFLSKQYEREGRQMKAEKRKEPLMSFYQYRL